MYRALFCLLFFSCSSPEGKPPPTPAPQTTPPKVEPPKVEPPKPSVASWKDPKVACHLMKDEGLDAGPQVTTGLVYFDMGDNEWTCISPNTQKMIGSETESLVEKSSLVYSASGNKTTIDLIYLSLYAFDRHKEARPELSRLVDILAKRLSLSLPSEASDAILKAKVGTWDAGGIIIDVRTERLIKEAKGSTTCVLFYEKGREVPPPGEC